MQKYSELFSLQLVLKHYDEFILNFDEAFSTYFKEANNKEYLKELIMKYLFGVKFTEEELKSAIKIQISRMDTEILNEYQQECQTYENNNQRVK